MTAVAAKEADALAAKAAKRELASDYDGAFKAYISAAQAYLALSKGATPASSSSSSPGSSPSSFKQSAAKCLDRAEKLKLLRPALRASLRDPLDPQEQQSVLDASAKLHDTILPAWSEQLPPEVYQEHPFEDPDFPLSIRGKVHPIWKRAVTQLNLHEGLDAQNVTQSHLSDCSLVAAIMTCKRHNVRFNTNLAWSALHPRNQDETLRKPQSGACAVKLHWNGSWKQVGKRPPAVPFVDSLAIQLTRMVTVIDDRLPVSEDGLLLSASSSNHKLWVPLLEKACLKLHGKGYTFDGSDPGFDLWTMTGWIPEAIDLQTARKENLWRELRDAAAQGRCLLTAGTGAEVPGDAPLVPKHAYSVHDLKEAEHARVVELCNPWRPAGHAAASQPLLDQSWEAFCSSFRILYVNWSSESMMGSTAARETAHFRIASEDDGHFKLQTKNEQAGQEVWVLLLRHKLPQDEDDSYISLAASQSSALTTSSKAQSSTSTRFTSELHTIIKVSSTKESPAWSLVASARNKGKPVNCSLFVYSASEVSLASIPKRYRYSQKISDAWTPSSAGGAHDSPRFYTNPQFLLTLNGSRLTTVAIRVHGDLQKSMNVKLIRGSHRVSSPTISDVVADAGSYAYGTSRFEKSSLIPQTYVIACSLFTTGDTSALELSVQSDVAFELSKLPPEGAGMFQQEIKDLCPAQQKKSFWVKNAQPFTLMARLQSQNAGQPQPFIQVFRAGEGAPHVTSGDLSVTPTGAFLQSTNLSAWQQGYIISASFASAPDDTPFRLLLYSSLKLDIQPLR